MKPIQRVNKSFNQLTGESTLLYNEIAREVSKSKGLKIINFGIGQPDIPTFVRIREAAKKALDEGFTGYTSAYGIEELRYKIAEYITSRTDQKISKDEVIITAGAKTALFMTFQLYIEPGDEVILFDPTFYSYAEVVKLLGGIPVYSKLRWGEDGFHIDFDDLSSKISNKTKMIVYNNPHNPTGSVFSKSETRNLVELCREKGIILVSDEIYDHFVYDTDFYSVLNESDWRDFIIYINGFSKTFSMTGWRLGFIIASSDVIKKLGVLAANIYTSPVSFVQKGALEAFFSIEEVKNMIRLFRERRDIMYNELSKINGIKVSKPNGTFYMFPNISKVLEAASLSSSKEFSIKLIESKGVITIPGEVFPLDVGKVFIRLSYAVDKSTIIEGVSKIREFIEEITQ
ncbi:MAG: pyridoxal phosphate-dependent aminotransferase [Sulfolobaceae archaeon]